MYIYIYVYIYIYYTHTDAHTHKYIYISYIYIFFVYMSNIYLHLLSRICKISISQSKSMYTYTTNTTNTNTQYRHIDAVHVLRARLRRKHTQNPCPATHCCREKKATPPAYTCTYVPPRGWLQQRFQITGTSMCITNMKKNINQYVSTWATPCHRVESFLFYPGPSPRMHNTPPRTRARAGGGAGGQTRGEWGAGWSRAPQSMPEKDSS